MTDLIWTLPLLLFASVVIGWGAEVAAVHISAGIALAVLAWLQTAPEFAVEAVIAWSRDSNLVLANLTGSLRLLMGLGWPMICFIHWISSAARRKTHPVSANTIQLPRHFAVESAGLAISVVYFTLIWAKGTWTTFDGTLLIGLYIFYFWMLNQQRRAGIHAPQESEGDTGGLVHKVLSLPKNKQLLWGGAFFVIGGGALITCAHPFLEALKTMATGFGVSEFVFIQWIAPIASEFPEKVTAFNWARKPAKVPMAIANMLSSIICQWTLMAGLVPIIFSISAGHPVTIHFSEFQEHEILLTIAQSALAVLLLADLKIKMYEAAGLFLLWLIQFFVPSSRTTLIPIYFAWFAIEGIRLMRKPAKCEAWTTLFSVIFGQRAPSR